MNLLRNKLRIVSLDQFVHRILSGEGAKMKVAQPCASGEQVLIWKRTNLKSQWIQLLQIPPRVLQLDGISFVLTGV